MESPERGALTLVRLVGVILVIVAALDLGLYWFKCHSPKNPQPVEIIPLILNASPALVGFVVLFKARAIAEWISNALDL